jgi:1-acyl-sn-glycerol-3-phosphate acyltransferase
MSGGLVAAAIFLALLAALTWLGRIGRRACKTDWGRPWLNRLDGLNRLFCRRFHRLRHGQIRLPDHGPAIVSANHVSGLDPLLLLAAARRPLRFLIAREWYDLFLLRWLFRAVGCIPVERRRNPQAAYRAAREALARGEVVAIFPHGRIALDDDHPPLKRGVLLLARLSGAPVVPVRLDGVRGQGRVLSAVWRRSRARLRTFPALYFNASDPDRLLERLARRLRGQSTDP